MGTVMATKRKPKKKHPKYKCIVCKVVLVKQPDSACGICQKHQLEEMARCKEERLSGLRDNVKIEKDIVKMEHDFEKGLITDELKRDKRHAEGTEEPSKHI
jgi:hypothetical protein